MLHSGCEGIPGAGHNSMRPGGIVFGPVEGDAVLFKIYIGPSKAEDFLGAAPVLDRQQDRQGQAAPRPALMGRRKELLDLKGLLCVLPFAGHFRQVRDVPRNVLCDQGHASWPGRTPA